MKNANLTKRLVEAALLIALSTVLSTLKLIDMPYGGSVTFASMLPVMLIGYRFGMRFGMASAGVYALIQQLLGLENFAYLPVPTPIAFIALAVFDYALAFFVIALGCVFKGRLGKGRADRPSSQGNELMLGAILVCVLRYICHTVGGATVWAGLPIPDGAALVYSIGYNATYMIPETVICALVALYLGRAIDFSRSIPMPFGVRSEEKRATRSGACRILALSAWLVGIGGVIADTCLIFKYIQDPESGDFTLSYMSEVNWIAVITVSAVCLAVAVGLGVASRTLLHKAVNDVADANDVTA